MNSFARAAQKTSTCAPSMAAPPPPPPVRLGTSADRPKLVVRRPRLTVADFAADGIITPANSHACWLNLFPADPRSVTRKEGKAFAQALAAQLSLSTGALAEIVGLSCSQRGTPIHAQPLFGHIR